MRTPIRLPYHQARTAALVLLGLMDCLSAQAHQSTLSPKGPAPFGQVSTTDLPALLQRNKYSTLVAQGDAFAAKKDWKHAVESYRQALDLCCGFSRQAFYGLVACAEAANDTEAEIEFYRAAINPTAGVELSRMGASTIMTTDMIRENNIDRVARFVLLLARSGKGDEALAAYLYLSDLTRQQSYKFSLPNRQEYEESKWQYSPELVEAMADVVRATDSESQFLTAAQREAILKEALKLQPYSAAVWYYYAEELQWVPKRWQEVAPAFKKALQYDHGEHPGVVEKSADF